MDQVKANRVCPGNMKILIRGILNRGLLNIEVLGNLKSMYEDRDARAPASMHSEKGSRNTVKGTMAKRSFVHLGMASGERMWQFFRENLITFQN